MMFQRRPSSDPLWRDEFSVEAAKERYVTRRQFSKFLVLTSFGMFAGNLWILIRSLRYKPRSILPFPWHDWAKFPSAESSCFATRRPKTLALW